MSESGPAGCRQSAPRTASHHGTPAARWRTSAGAACTARWNTADTPSRSASVTWPVAFTKVANCALVTALVSMRYGETRTACTGRSPSAT